MNSTNRAALRAAVTDPLIAFMDRWIRRTIPGARYLRILADGTVQARDWLEWRTVGHVWTFVALARALGQIK